MMRLLFEVIPLCWVVSLLICVLPGKQSLLLSRSLLTLGCALGVIGAILSLPFSTESVAIYSLLGEPLTWILSPAALWLMGFGLFAALFACWLSPLTHTQAVQRGWLVGASFALLGAWGVFGLQNAISFLIAWEVMSLGGALLLLTENKITQTGRSVFFMLAMLEIGAVFLIIAFLLLSQSGRSMQFNYFEYYAHTRSVSLQTWIGIFLLIGFGAKLGLIPFYEWLPNAYTAGSGSTGNLFSGVILNAAFFALARGLFSWVSGTQEILGIIVVIVGVLTGIFTIFQAFQQQDWRRLLSFSTAENAAIAVSMLGAALLFQTAHFNNLAGLACIVAFIHIAGHSLAKGTLFLAADAVFFSSQHYKIQQNGILKQLGILFGVGTLFGAMSLSAMPPTAGFMSEWYAFQVVFQGFHLASLPARLTLIFAGAGLALTAALALASFVKAFGVGLLGAKNDVIKPITLQLKISILILGLSILLFSFGMVRWIDAIHFISLHWFNINSAIQMHTNYILVPLSDHFAFISPTLLMIVTPCLAVIPALILFYTTRRYVIKRTPVWYGGIEQDSKLVATTASTFSNAMLTFYRFMYLPRQKLNKLTQEKPYFIKSILFQQTTTAIFQTYVFKPVTSLVMRASSKIRAFQSGDLNFYNGVIGVLFILILVSVFFI